MKTLDDIGRKLVENHINIAHWRASYWKERLYSYDYDELVGYSYLGIVKAGANYDPKRGSFSTIATIYCDREIMQMLRKEKQPTKPVVEKYLDEKDYDNYFTEDNYKFIDRDLVRNIISQSGLKEKESKVINLYFYSGKHQNQITKIMNLSQSQVSRIFISAKNKLRSVAYENCVDKLYQT